MTLQATSLAWSKANLTSLAGAPPSVQPKPYVRHDGVSAIVSYSASPATGNRRIFELTHEGGQWLHWDLLHAAASGQPAEGHTPFGYTRSDGVSAVVYLSTVEFGVMEIHELSLRTGQGWSHANLTAITGAPLSVGGLLQGYVRADGINAVIFRAEDGHVHELALEGGTRWTHWDLTAAAGAPTGAAQQPSGSVHAFARPDGVTAVLYASDDGRVRQLRLGTDRSWRSQTLTSSGNPKAHGHGLTGYIRTDGVVAIVYRGKDKHLYELTRDANGEFDVLHDLTAITGAAPAEGHVHAYNRADGISTVIYEGPDFHTHELALEGGVAWSHNDLTAGIGSRPGFQPSGYIRGDGSTAIVYYDTDQKVRQLKLS